MQVRFINLTFFSLGSLFYELSIFLLKILMRNIKVLHLAASQGIVSCRVSCLLCNFQIFFQLNGNAFYGETPVIIYWQAPAFSHN